MTPTKKFLYHSAAYTVAISLMLFAFAKIIGINEFYLTFSRYFIVVAFSTVISASEYLLTIDKLSIPFRYVIHYTVLAIAFFFVFLSIRNSDGNYRFSTATVFAALAIFSAFYFLILAVVVLVKRKKHKKGKKKAKKGSIEQEYTPKFK